MRKLLIIFICLLPLLGLTQTSNVTATITDTDGQVWNNGTYIINFVPTPGNPGPYTQNGVPFNQGPFTGVLSNSGVLTITLPDNSTIQPSGSQWQFVVCPNASSPCGNKNVAVIGTAPNLSSTLSASVPVVRFPAINTTFGYADAEVTPVPKPGGTYYNVSSGCLRIWSGSAWGCSTGTIVNLSSPPPIGDVLPNIIDASVLNGVVDVQSATGTTADQKITNAEVTACAGQHIINMSRVSNVSIAALTSIGCSDGSQLFVIWGSQTFTPASDVNMFLFLPGSYGIGSVKVDVTGISGYSHKVYQLSGNVYDNQPGNNNTVLAPTKLPDRFVFGGANNTGDALYLEAVSNTTNYIEFVDMGSMNVMGMLNCVHARITNNSWVNANKFDKVQCSNSVNSLNVDFGSSNNDAFIANSFVDFESEYAVAPFTSQGLNGVIVQGTGIFEGNRSNNTSFWDWSCNPPACHTININYTNPANAGNNIFIGQLELTKSTYTKLDLWGSWDTRNGFLIGDITNPTGIITSSNYHASNLALGYGLGNGVTLYSDNTHNTVIDAVDGSGGVFLRTNSGTNKFSLGNLGTLNFVGAWTTQDMFDPVTTTSTSGDFINFDHSTSTYTGTVWYANVAHGSGSCSSGFFAQWLNNSVGKFSVDCGGNTVGKGTGDFAGFKVSGTSGFTGTKTAGSCVLTISGGIITNVTGC